VSPPVRLPGAPLTPEQRRLFDSEPELPTQAAAAAIKGAGRAAFRHLAFAEMVSIATIGAMEATQVYDPAEGTSYRKYAFFAAVLAVLGEVRREKKGHAKMRAMLRASAMVYFTEVDVDVEIGVDTDESLVAKLNGFSNTILGLAVSHVATMAVPGSFEEDELGEREAAAQAGEALRALLPAPGSAERTVIDLYFVQGLPLTKVAEAMGIDKPRYQTFRRRFHELMASLREGMEARGIDGRAPWREDISGHALTAPDEGA